MKIHSAILTTLAFVAAAPARGQIVDVRPYVSDNQIRIKGFIDSGSIEVPDRQVFAYNFGDLPEDPYFIQDPGFNAAAASGLPPGSQVSFNILSGLDFDLPGNLSYWNGTGSVSFGALPGGETLRLNFGSNNRVVGGTAGFQAGFILQTITASGSMHRHLNAFLNGGSGDPATGIYLLALNLESSDASIADSSPFFLVYNNGLSQQIRNDAMQWVENNLLAAAGDLNGDGAVDSLDIDFLWSIVRGGDAGDTQPDLNDDGFVNEDDLDYLLANLLDAGPNRAYGDADLDGGVGGLDFTAWRLRAGTGWASGDFDGDGGIGGLDFTLWRTRPTAYPSTVGLHSGGANPFVAAPSAVPEPGSAAIAVLAIPTLALALRRKPFKIARPNWIINQVQ